MGEVAHRLADRVVLTDDNPRSEDPSQIVADILSGIEAPDAVHIEHDRASAIRVGIAAAGANDLVLVAGKGHEDYQEVAGQRLPFSDIEQVQQALQGGAA
jgi:UDP-N-acetylmuramoyl-L-alanyl-D-glutamate--2,6-diaminopimelate ligase